MRDHGADRRGRNLVVLGGVAVACLVAALAWWPDASSRAHVAGNLLEASRSPGALTGQVPAPVNPRAPVSEPPGKGPDQVQPTPTAQSTTPPDVPSRPLGGAPLVTMWRPHGADAEILTWRSGDPTIHVLTRIPGALTGFVDEPTSGTVSPNGRLLLVQVYRPANPAEDLLRLFRISDGRLLWHAENLGPFVATLWRPGGNGLALGAIPSWVFIDITPNGVVSQRMLRTPVESILGPRFTDRVLPAAFSADGRWVYGASGGTSAPEYRPVVRVSWATGRAETIDSHQSSGDAGRDAAPAVALRTDPATGRTLQSPLVDAAQRAPGRVAVRNRDGTIAFRMELETVLAVEWTGDGDLALEADRRLQHGATSTVAVAPGDGTIPGIGWLRL